MARRDYNYYELKDFRGGICEEPENAQPNQVIDSRNMWAPSGRLEQRPGYVGVGPMFVTSGVGTLANTLVENTAASTFLTGATLNVTANYRQAMTSSVVGDLFYVMGPTFAGSFFSCSFTWGVGVRNTNLTKIKAEYYNGTSWIYLPILQPYAEVSSGSADGWTITTPFAIPHFANGGTTATTAIIAWAPPNDWAAAAVNGSSTGTGIGAHLQVRFRLLNADISDQLNIDTTYLSTNPIAATYTPSVGLAVFLKTRRVICATTTGTQIVIKTTADTAFGGGATRVMTGVPGAQDTPLSIAVIPTFDEAYFMYGGDPYVINIQSEGTLSITAKIEDRPEYVGTIAGITSNYNPSQVAQAGSFPKGKFITWFQNQLWIANLNENPFAFRWSAPTDATNIGYRVWPNGSYEILEEDDNSPITGLTSLNEHLIIFKGDSIWRIALVGQDSLGLNVYAAVKVVSGIGCVANGTIQRTPQGLVFLYDDGVYLFDGNEAVKISAALDLTFQSLNPSVKSKATAVHWQTKKCYLIALPFNSSTNNRVLVWDYKHNAWWHWDGIQVSSWLRSEEQNDLEAIYFADNSGYLYQLGVGDTNYGTAISSYITTHRIGEDSRQTEKSFRQVNVLGTNDTTSISVTPFRDDLDVSVQTASTLLMTDTNDVLWSSATYSSSTYCNRKRKAERLDVRISGQWLQVKVANSTKNQRMHINRIGVGYTVKGVEGGTR